MYTRTVHGQMYCIVTKHTAADQMIKFGGGHTFLGVFTAATKFNSSANADIGRRRLGRLLCGAGDADRMTAQTDSPEVRCAGRTGGGV